MEHRVGDAPRPLSIRRYDGWFDRDHYLRALDDKWYRALVELQTVFATATFEYFRDYANLFLPLTTNSVSSPMGHGSDSLPVQIELAGQSTYLADSMQFMLEYGCRLTDRPGCWYLMPSFRGEEIDESHLSQFMHAEAEIRGGLEDVMMLVDGYVAHLCAAILDTCAEHVVSVAGKIDHLVAGAEGGFPRVSFDEAVATLGGDPRYVQPCADHARALTRAGEQRLLAVLGEFVWVIEPDHLSVPFYQAFSDEAEMKALAGDLLFGLGEVVGAGERHSGTESLGRALSLHGVDQESYAWYTDMREARPMRTSGFGLGTERFFCWALQHGDIRDCQVLPRGRTIQVGAP